LTHSFDGEIKGLKEWKPEDQPPVTAVFWSFRVMVALGFAMIITGIFALFLYYRKRLFDTRWFQFWCIVMSPSGFIALLAGWFVTEIGRQPYTVYEVLRTSESISPVIGPQIAITLLAFVIVYSSIFGTACYYIIKLIKKGPKIGDEKEEFYDHSMLPVQVIKELTPKTERG
jgi:cytochrome d ubiquinol oxidase subunit I